jgi:Family of unknown function (DUF5990)
VLQHRADYATEDDVIHPLRSLRQGTDGGDTPRDDPEVERSDHRTAECAERHSMPCRQHTCKYRGPPDRQHSMGGETAWNRRVAEQCPGRSRRGRQRAAGRKCVHRRWGAAYDARDHRGHDDVDRGPFPPSHRTIGAFGPSPDAHQPEQPQYGARVRIRIEASDLPGRNCPPGANNFPGYRNVHVGVQKRGKPDELFGVVPGDAQSAAWTLECDVNGADIKGPYVQGRPGDRFIYLSWGNVDDGGTFRMFRRAKLMLDAIDATMLRAAQHNGVLVARLGLTDECGHPLCAAVRPPTIQWTA